MTREEYLESLIPPFSKGMIAGLEAGAGQFDWLAKYAKEKNLTGEQILAEVVGQAAVLRKNASDWRQNSIDDALKAKAEEIDKAWTH